jgi:hypothetical protein
VHSVGGSLGARSVGRRRVVVVMVHGKAPRRWASLINRYQNAELSVIQS